MSSMIFKNLWKAKRRLPKPDDLIKTWRIVRGDTVQVMAGKDRGKKGVVKTVFRDRNRVIVEGLNLVKKNIKSTPKMKGGQVTREAGLHASKLSLIDPIDGKPTRVRWGFLPDEQRKVGEMSPKGKVRISKRSGTIIPRPKILTERKGVRHKDSPKDTPPALAIQVTYQPPID